MKKVIVIFFIFVINLVVLGIGIGVGDLDINITLTPEIPTKKYNTHDSVLLDVGDINKDFLSTSVTKKIAVVTVNMQTKENKTSTLGQVDYCSIDGGDFASKYRIRELRNISEEIKTSLAKKYYGGNNIEIKLYQKNFKIINADVITNDGFNDTYAFSAYPEKCMTISGGRDSNLIKSLSYSFEIWIEIKNAKAGDIVRTDVTVGNTKANEEAIGAIKDLVKEQFSKIQAN